MLKSALVLLIMLCFGYIGYKYLRDSAPPAELKQEVPEFAQTRQLVLVIAPSWDTSTAEIACFERPNAEAPWAKALPNEKVSIGKNGLAWGIGLHGTHPPGSSRVKREGDGKAPAGIFAITTAFGYATPPDSGIKEFPYLQLTPQLEGVDDTNSRFYNRIVDSSKVEKDWNSSEQMRREDDLYRWGAVVGHNEKPYPGYGSCIFLHCWRGPDQGTAGCTASDPRYMEEMLRWLRKDSAPLIVQLTRQEYERLKNPWRLP